MLAIARSGLDTSGPTNPTGPTGGSLVSPLDSVLRYGL